MGNRVTPKAAPPPEAQLANLLANRFFNTSNHHLALVMPFLSPSLFHTSPTL